MRNPSLSPKRAFRALEDLFRERRFPTSWANWVQGALHEKPLRRALDSGLRTRPLPCVADASTELHMLTCRSDVGMAILALKSLLRFEPKLAVVIHGDASLDAACVSIIERHIPGCRIVTLEEADRIARRYPAIDRLREKIPARFTLGEGWERHRRAWALKVFDLHLCCETEKLICVDSDTLFLKKPDEISSWIEERDPRAFHTVPYLPNLKVGQTALADLLPNVTVIPSFNSGLFGFSRSRLPIDRMTDVVNRLMDQDVPVFSDECIWRYAFSQIDRTSLPYDLYPLFGKASRFRQFMTAQEEFKYVHFILKHRGGFYRSFAARVVNELELALEP